MIEVLKQSAEDVSKAYDVLAFAHTERALELLAKTRTSLRQAIKELESQELVALPCCGYRDASAVKWNPLNDVVQCHNCGQTYAHPPQRTWVGLTDEEKDHLIGLHIRVAQGAVDAWIEGLDDFIQAIEAKLKEKNT